MEKRIKEKSLINVNEKNIFYKIKVFFVKLFKGNDIAIYTPEIKNVKSSDANYNAKLKDNFIETLRNVEDEETRLLKLQRQYENSEINTKQLSKEQLVALKEQYKKQISELEKSNENRKRKILERKDGNKFLESIKSIENDETKLLKLQKQYDSENIETKDVPKNQIKVLINLYKKQIAELSKSNKERKQKLLQYRNKMQNS